MNTSLDRDEKLEVLRVARERCNGRIPLLTGVAEYTTAGACRFAEAAAKAGVDGLMVLPAMVYKSDRRETIAHFRTVARATGLPVMCYNNPVSYGVDITPEMFAELADEPALVAIKESSENVRRITDLKNIVGDRYILFEGVDDLALEGILLGAQGWYLASSTDSRGRAWRFGICSAPENSTKPWRSIAGSLLCSTWTPGLSWCSPSSW